MSEEKESLINELGRQPDPKPPLHIASAPPSLLLYSGLLIFAVILLLIAFRIKSTDWPGFLLNLATEIIGAVIILILVERRFRASEIRFIQGIPETTSSFILNWFSGEAKEIRAYVAVLSTQVKLASLPSYLSRPQVEAVLLNNRSKGLILTGDYGMGKTTLLHQLVRSQANDVLENPRSALVPILVPAIRWNDNETVEVLSTTLQNYYPVRVRTFRRLLERGRLMCIFDGVDELLDPKEVIERLKRFHQQFPNNVLFISSRPLGYDVFEGLELEQFEIPPLTKEEVYEVFRSRGVLDKINSYEVL